MDAPRPRRRATLLLAIGSALAAQAPDGEALLRKADALRYPWPAFHMDVTLTLKQQSQAWQVHVAPNRDARIEGRSEKEKGRTILVLGEDMWLVLPTAKRPVKVTPQQRLLGPAAGGDLARAALADDYAVAAAAPDTLDGRPCQRLDLAARRPTLTYRTLRLWILDSGVPLKAEYHLASGKLARTAAFDPPSETQGRKVMAGMTLTEPNGFETRVRFDHWAPEPHDPERFRLPAVP